MVGWTQSVHCGNDDDVVVGVDDDKLNCSNEVRKESRFAVNALLPCGFLSSIALTGLGI